MGKEVTSGETKVTVKADKQDKAAKKVHVLYKTHTRTGTLTHTYTPRAQANEEIFTHAHNIACFHFDSS